MSERYPGVFDSFSETIEKITTVSDSQERQEELFGDDDYRRLYDECLANGYLTDNKHLLLITDRPRIGSHPMVVWPNHQINHNTGAYFQFISGESYPDIIETASISGKAIETMQDGYCVISEDIYWERCSGGPRKIVLASMNAQEDFDYGSQNDRLRERVSYKRRIIQHKPPEEIDYPLSDCIVYVARPIGIKRMIPSPLHFDLRDFPDERAEMAQFIYGGYEKGAKVTA